MTIALPQDPAPWAAKILDLKNATEFQVFSVIMVGGQSHAITRPESMDLASDECCARVSGPEPEGLKAMLGREWVLRNRNRRGLAGHAFQLRNDAVPLWQRALCTRGEPWG
jgi:hypothetical protein